MEDANAISLKSYEEKNLCQLWVFIRDGEGKGDGYLQSAYNRCFLKYDTDNNTFVAVADKNDATRIRLVETSGNYDHWQIELPDVDGNSNLISHSYSGEGSSKTVSLSLQGPNNGNNFVDIFPVDITPVFYEEAGGAFRNINLDELTPKLELTADGRALKAKASASEDDADNSWKNIGTKDDFVLRNGHGQYIGAEKTACFVLQIVAIDIACTIHNRIESPLVAIAFKLLRGGGNGLDVLAVIVKHNAAAARKLQVVVI